MHAAKRFWRDGSGATAIEYGSIAIISMVKGVGGSLPTAFSKVSGNLR